MTNEKKCLVDSMVEFDDGCVDVSNIWCYHCWHSAMDAIKFLSLNMDVAGNFDNDELALEIGRDLMVYNSIKNLVQFDMSFKCSSWLEAIDTIDYIRQKVTTAFNIYTDTVEDRFPVGSAKRLSSEYDHFIYILDGLRMILSSGDVTME